MRQQSGWLIACIAALSALYAIVFTLADGELTWPSLFAAVANAGPAILLGWVVAIRIAPGLWPVRRFGTALGIAATLVAYALITYVLTIVLLALFWDDGTREGGVFIRYFTGPAFVWQSFQGLAYGLIALLVGWVLHSENLRSAPPPSADVPPAPPTPLGRLLLRTDQGIVPVEADAIIRIAAADDYSEVVLASNRHLARMSLSDCERLLANEPIVRIHRSHLINLRCLVSAEPTGDGRLQLTLSNGDQLTTSRTGARLIREQSG